MTGKIHYVFKTQLKYYVLIFKKALIVNRHVCNYAPYVLLSMFVFCETCECIYEY